MKRATLSNKPFLRGLSIETLRFAMREFEKWCMKPLTLQIHVCGPFPPAESWPEGAPIVCLVCDFVWEAREGQWVKQYEL